MELPRDIQSQLQQHREAIDKIDAQVVELLNCRAQQSLAIAAIKRSAGLPILSLERENEVMSRIIDHNQGPHSDLQMMGYFTNIIENSRQLQNESMKNEGHSNE